MGKLSLKSYGWKCVLGTEVLYVICLAYGALITGPMAQLHHALFELLPGFTWGTTSGVLIGAVELFALAWIFAAYFVWMHNSSLTDKNN